MSLGIVFKGPEGIVLAVDSRVTLTAQVANQQVIIPATYDNATKLLHVKRHDYVGAITYGAGAFGMKEPRTAHSFLPELEDELSGQERLPIADFAKRLSDFFSKQWAERMPAQMPPGNDIIFIVAGYNAGEPYGRVFEISIPSSPNPQERMGGAADFGMIWGGQREFVDRLVQGFDDALPTQAQQLLSLTDEARNQLREQLRTRLQVPIPYLFLPLQDCIDFSIFLVRATITMQKYWIGLRGVGGAIDVATVTPPGNFTLVQAKKIIGERIIERGTIVNDESKA